MQREIRKLATDAISIYSLTVDLLGVLKKVVGYRIAIILDEAHTMVHLHSNKFVAASFVEGTIIMLYLFELCLFSNY